MKNQCIVADQASDVVTSLLEHASGRVGRGKYVARAARSSGENSVFKKLLIMLVAPRIRADWISRDSYDPGRLSLHDRLSGWKERRSQRGQASALAPAAGADSHA